MKKDIANGCGQFSCHTVAVVKKRSELADCPVSRHSLAAVLASSPGRPQAYRSRKGTSLVTVWVTGMTDYCKEYRPSISGFREDYESRLRARGHTKRQDTALRPAEDMRERGFCLLYGTFHAHSPASDLPRIVTRIHCRWVATVSAGGAAHLDSHYV